jgi:hypothetical protein
VRGGSKKPRLTEFMRAVILHAPGTLYHEVPTNPRQWPQRVALWKASRDLPFDPRGWAYASIALGIEDKCDSSEEFRNRCTNWRNELRRLCGELEPRGVRIVGERIKITGRCVHCGRHHRRWSRPGVDFS